MQNFMQYNFPINNIILACFVAPGSGAPVHKNRNCHGLVYHTSGLRYYQFDQVTLHAGPGEILYLPKGSDYIVKTEETGGCYAINFDYDDTTAFAPFSFKVKNPGTFLPGFKQAEQAWRTKSSGFEMKCKGELFQIIVALRKEYEMGYVSKDTEDILKPALHHIHAAYTGDNIAVPYLADLCGVSETYFRQIFKKALGVSPIKYMNELKLARAKELISSGMYSIGEIAELSGFHDESYFSREFKKATGTAPSKYY